MGVPLILKEKTDVVERETTGGLTLFGCGAGRRGSKFGTC